MRHVLEIDDLSVPELERILELARRPVAEVPPLLSGQGVACYFAKPSARTRNSTEMAVVQLGGHPVYITAEEVGIDQRESAEDVTRTLACYHRAICARVFEHELLERMAAVDVVPVINLLSDGGHPLQAIADVLTIEAECGPVAGRNIVYVGDANNVARSLVLAIGSLGGKVTVVAPPDRRFNEVDVDRLSAAGAPFTYGDRPEAVTDADVVYTDTWVSMGQEGERDQLLRTFEGYQVDDAMMARNPDSIFLHCLPAHRNEEVTDSVLDGAQSRIWPQAANRLPAVRAVLQWLLEVNTEGGA
ncbi:MAG: ornithine carbamoyltransferase [Acidimicrobiia bacterium]|nr:ornithine carbamoyltransferase [Acidimicrobiia bacterium]